MGGAGSHLVCPRGGEDHAANRADRKRANALCRILVRSGRRLAQHMTPEPAPPLGAAQRRRRARHRILWRLVNPPTRPLAGVAPWWVPLETRGRRTGLSRTTPLARGPVDGDVVWLASVHGRNADWVRNLEATPEVRIKLY